MRFLVDAQLPPDLARWLTERGHQAEHVLDYDMMESSDHSIWARAVAVAAVIITKHQDFVTLHSVDPNGAAVVWVRIGNTRRREFLSGFDKVLPDIERALASSERLIEIA